MKFANIKEYPIIRFAKMIAIRFGNYILAAVVWLLNLRFVFDNVLWGDEAFSADMVHHSWDKVLYHSALGENHPPLYYLWLKLWAEILGYRGEVYHFASFIVFTIGIVLAFIFFRKKMGNLPLTLYLIITGLSASCLEYNVEIRMYALAFLGITFAFYSTYCALKSNKWLAWLGIVLFGLIAAYSHYYGLLTAIIILFFTALSALILHKKKSLKKIIVSIILFIAGYAPWIHALVTSYIRTVANWWMTEPDTLAESMMMVFGGPRMARLLIFFLLAVSGVVFINETGLLRFMRQDKKCRFEIHLPYFRDATAEFYTIGVGLLTILGTVACGYIGSALIRPMVARRFFYPLLGIVTVICMLGTSYCIRLAHSKQSSTFPQLVNAVKAAFVVFALVLLWRGALNYQQFNENNQWEADLTQDTIDLIGSVTDQPVLVNNGVLHIGWSVLSYYFPEGTVINSGYEEIDADDFWYFVNYPLSQEELDILSEKGYQYTDYGRMRISIYHFVVYRFQR